MNGWKTVDHCKMSADNYAVNYILEQLKQTRSSTQKKEKVIEAKLQIAFLSSHIWEEIYRLRKCKEIDDKNILRLISGTDIVQLMESNLKEQLSLLDIELQNRLLDIDISSLIDEKKSQIPKTQLKAIHLLISDIKDNYFLRNYKFEAAKSRNYYIPPNPLHSIVNDLDTLLLQQSLTSIESSILYHYFDCFSPDNEDDCNDVRNLNDLIINEPTQRNLTFSEINLKIKGIKKDIDSYKMKNMNKELEDAEQELESFQKLKNSLIYHPRKILKILKLLLLKYNINVDTNIDDRIKKLKPDIEYNIRKNNQKQLHSLQLEENDLTQIKDLYSIIKSPHFKIMTIESEISDYQKQFFFTTEDELQLLIRSANDNISIYKKWKRKEDVEKEKKHLNTLIYLQSLFFSIERLHF